MMYKMYMMYKYDVYLYIYINDSFIFNSGCLKFIISLPVSKTVSKSKNNKIKFGLDITLFCHKLFLRVLHSHLLSFSIECYCREAPGQDFKILFIMK